MAEEKATVADLDRFCARNAQLLQAKMESIADMMGETAAKIREMLSDETGTERAEIEYKMYRFMFYLGTLNSFIHSSELWDWYGHYTYHAGLLDALLTAEKEGR